MLLIAVCFLKLLYLTSKMLLKVNNIAGDKEKSLICRVFSEAEMIFFCVYVEFCII